jgi:sugar phosphate isomerase/epimerase
MRIGTMNHPGRDPLQEIQWMARMGLEFIDLTLEPPLAGARSIDPKAIAALLRENQFEVVGHTAYYLPLCSPFESLRRAAVDELKLCLEVFAALGVKWMNLHPGSLAPLHDRRFIIDRNLQSIRDLLPTAQALGIGLMIENLPGSFNTVAQVAELLEPIPELGLHLDIGHANLMSDHNTTDELLAAYGGRLRHVHLHDNKGGSADLHLPLGAGTLDTVRYIRSLQAGGYDGTITLEVFTPDRQHLAYSRDVLRTMWDAEKKPELKKQAAGATKEPAACGCH